jgi:hypothetical protein
MKKDYRKLVGYVPSPVVSTASFAIPIYQNIDTFGFEVHKVEEGLKFITSFDEIPKRPEQMIVLPEFLERFDVEVGDSPFFVITMNALLFVGTAEELSPHIEGIKKLSGDNFIKELELIPI